jgi:hypothetical protein
MEQHVCQKPWYLPTSLHGVTTQNNIVTPTAVRTAYLTSIQVFNLCRLLSPMVFSFTQGIRGFIFVYSEKLTVSSTKNPY